MKYCTKCVLPESHESIKFDSEGVCNICRQSEIKHGKIDWVARKKLLNNIVEKYRNKDQYDCIVPFSGGKDSTFQLLYIVKELKLKPLVVKFNHWGYRPLVQENNNRTFKNLGVDILEFTPNWKIVRLLMLESLKKTGDSCWHCHTGIFSYVMRTAVKYNIPLVIWGESSAEYRSYCTAEELEEVDEKIFNEMINLGISSENMFEFLDGKVDKRDLMTFQFPKKEELQRIGAKAIYLGNYIKWDTKKQVEIIKKELNWKGQPVEGIPLEYDYEKIECRWQGVRDYCKFIKRGHGRTNHLACIDIRNGAITREHGMQISLEYDGKRPASLDLFLEVLGISETEFETILLNKSVINWGFNNYDVPRGEPLQDMYLWEKII